jgi:hypothetical protein
VIVYMCTVCDRKPRDAQAYAIDAPGTCNAQSTCETDVATCASIPGTPIAVRGVVLERCDVRVLCVILYCDRHGLC